MSLTALIVDFEPAGGIMSVAQYPGLSISGSKVRVG